MLQILKTGWLFARAELHYLLQGKKWGEIILSPRTGRPKSNNPKNVRLELRLTKEEANLIQECADRLNTSRTDVINRGVKKIKSELDS